MQALLLRHGSRSSWGTQVEGLANAQYQIAASGPFQVAETDWTGSGMTGVSDERHEGAFYMCTPSLAVLGARPMARYHALLSMEHVPLNGLGGTGGA